MAEKDRNIRPRDKEIRIKVTESELQYAKDKAAYCGLTMSEYIRKVIFDGVIINFQGFDIKALTVELNRIGTNINQIARHVNEKGGEYDRQDMDSLISEFQDMQSAIYEKVWGISGTSSDEED